MEHDDRCAKQDMDLAVMQTEMKAMNAALDSAIARWQRLVDEFHAHNVTLATMKADVGYIKEKVDLIDEALKNDFAPKSEVREVKGWIVKGIGTVLGFVLLSVLSLLKWGK